MKNPSISAEAAIQSLNNLAGEFKNSAQIGDDSNRLGRIAKISSISRNILMYVLYACMYFLDMGAIKTSVWTTIQTPAVSVTVHSRRRYTYCLRVLCVWGLYVFMIFRPVYTSMYVYVGMYHCNPPILR